MKKISLLVLFCMILSLVLASCGNNASSGDNNTQNETTHEHAYGTAWSFDAANHYHACTCGSQSDVAAHADANNDGACDACALVLSNAHVFASEWTTDELNHWHASLCGHSVVDAKAAHTADAIGNCSVCGVKVSAITFDSVEDAIQLALDQEYIVKTGSIFHSYPQYNYEYDYWEIVNQLSYFEKSEGYLHVTELAAAYEAWYYAVGDSVWSVVTESGITRPNPEAYTVDNLKGYYFNGAILDYSTDAQAYGVADLLDALYFLGENSLIALESDVTTTEDGTLYTYSFGLPYYGGIHLVEVYFTLDQQSYFVDKAYVAVATVEDGDGIFIEYEVDADGEYVYDEDFNLVVKSVDFDEDFEAEFDHYYDIAQGLELDVPTPETSVVPSFVLKDADGNTIGDTVTLTIGEYVYLDILANGGDISLDPVVATVVNANGEEAWTLVVGTWSEGQLILCAYEEADFYVTVSTSTYSVSFKVEAEIPAVNSFEVGVYSNIYDEYEYRSEVDVLVNGIVDFKALVNDYADASYTVTVDGAADTYVLEEDFDCHYFVASALGTYTITLTSTIDPSFSATLTVNVVEPEGKNIADVLKGKYEIMFSGMTAYKLEFTPASTGATYGNLTIKDQINNYITGNYTYEYSNDKIVVKDSNGEVVTSFTLELDENLDMFFNNGYTSLPIVKVDDAGNDNIVLNDQLLGKVFTDGTYFLTFELYEDEYYAILSDVYMGRPQAVNIYFSYYNVEEAFEGIHHLTLVVDEDQSMGTNPYDDYTSHYVTNDFETIVFDHYGTTVEFTVYNPYA